MRAACLVAAVGAWLGLFLGASAATAAAADVAGLARSVARPWPDLQRADGSFPDEVAEIAREPRDPYGNAMLGYALLDHGLREGDEQSISSALRAVGYAIRHPDVGHRAIFEDLPLASAYNLARARLADDPRFTALRADWEARLRRIRLVGIGGPRPYFNWYLVEAVAILELLRTGIDPGAESGSVLAQPAESARVVEDLINRELPATVRRYTRDDLRAGPLTIVSDPPHNPPAYHAFSLGLLARGLELLGPRASTASRDLLDRAVRASWALAAPDGDLAYFGRSQEQSWALAMTAYGAETAARLPGIAAEQAARYTAVSERVLGRLRELHLDDRGLSITPALRRDLANGVRGLDGYVSASAYGGLTLVGLN
ncbi:MAG: hypothetical protein M3N16_06420, partial [Actinomycetota bacterium]|nr:hypothetical protein [Actinomycetota bacterium]